MKYSIFKWLLLGLFLRLLIMPFSFHGHDIFYIYYYPFKFITQNFYDPYAWIALHNPHNQYYSPLVLHFFSFFLIIFKPFLPFLENLFQTFEAWNFTWEGNSIHYASVFSDLQLFRTLFLFKMPYLICDLGCGWILTKLFEDRSKAILAFKCWMLNPFTLHSAFALGQMDIIPTFLILAAFISYKKSWIAATTLLLCAGLFKIYAILLLPYFAMTHLKTFSDRHKAVLWCLLFCSILYLPFLISSKTIALEALFFGSSRVSSLNTILFISLYVLLLIYLWWKCRTQTPTFESTFLSLIIPLLLFFSLQTVTIRYFIVVTPMLIFLALTYKTFWIYNALFFISLFGMSLGGNTQQWGLFAPLEPRFFSSLPILDSYLTLFMDLKLIHQLLFRVFVITCLIVIAHSVYLVKKHYEQLKNLS
ncbi:MAG: hypothetical protein HYS98_02575 [Deltaproteobacteria bacterium]|nr:hypothetical protein [Deltaproteobacteria bacterium]